MAGIMHDIGKVKIPDSILTKPEALNNAEWKVMQRHPAYGHEILDSAGDIEEEIKVAVLQHHERLDRGGYPLSPSADKISLYSRIISVADSFDAMTSERVYRKSFSIFKASKELMADALAGKLDVKIVIPFVNYVLDMSPGHKVRLNTGKMAEVILPNKAEPDRPLVQAQGEFINLEKARNILVEDFD